MDTTDCEKRTIGGASASAMIKRNYVVELLVMLFGLGSWFGLTAIFSQMPKIAASAPEGWLLPFHLTITAQCANAISMLYVHAQKSRQFNDAHVISMLMVVGCVAAICMPFTYHLTIGDLSIALHFFTFIFATIGGFSSMVFMPFMRRFRDNYLLIFFFGQAFNDILSNALAMIQGMWSSSECIFRELQWPQFARHILSPNYTPTIAFLFVFPVLAMGTVAFILISRMKLCRDELTVAVETIDLNNGRRCDLNGAFNASAEVQELPKLKFYHLIVANALIGFGATGIFPFIHSFTCQLCSHHPISYNLSIVLIVIFNPLICFIAACIPCKCIRLIRMCKTRVAILVPYLLFYTFGFFCGWPLHSLLGLILLVS